jgi:hypothetical protein
LVAEIPEHLFRKLKMLAITERKYLREVVIEAVEMYIASKSRKGNGGK